MSGRSLLAVLGIAAVGAATLLGARQAPAGPPYSPAESQKTFALEPGFRIELAASEPDVQSPVAMDIDEHGRWFVVEMPGYPLDVRPTGKVKLLEDTDGDGRPDRSSVFADGLVLPHGVMRWKKGVLVAAAPDILYLEDSDDDGRADVRRVVLTGFAFSNPQHTVNSPLYGLDNWIYLAHQGAAGATIYKDLFGDRGKPLTFPEKPDVAPVGARDRSIRFRLDTWAVEPIAGESQFGHAFDAYGRYFGNDNSHHLWHEAIAARYLQRNPHLPVRAVMRDIPEHGAAAKVFPITQRPTFELLTEAGEFTSASAPTAYLGGAWPAAFDGSFFVAEPVHNLVHRDVVTPAGPGFVARRAHEAREFLAAGDAWFRPVNFYVGPDGALYVIDYYRARIEHPEWTASEAHRDPRTLYAGQDRGRVYRVTHEQGRHERAPVMPGGLTPEQLAHALAHPNAWWRRTAQRLIVQDRRTNTVPHLRTLLTGASPLGVLHAAWTLDGLGVLQPEDLARLFTSKDPGVRENGVRLAERWLTSDPATSVRVIQQAGDPDLRVRFQVLATLGDLDTPEAARVHEQLLFNHLDEEWMVVAGLSAGSDRAARLFDRVRHDPGIVSHTAFVRQIAGVIGARQQSGEVMNVVSAVAESGGPGAVAWRAAALEGLAAGMRGRSASGAALGQSRDLLLALIQEDAAPLRAAALGLLRAAGPGDTPAWKAAVEDALAVAARADHDPGRRADAIALVALDRPETRVEWLEGLVSPREPEPVQVAAVQALGRISTNALERHAAERLVKSPRRAAEIKARLSSSGIGSFLLERWPQFTRAVRSAAADVLLEDETRTWLLVRALEKGAVQPWTLDFWQKRDLLMHRTGEIRAASRALLEEDPQRRAETFRRYAAALDLAGDPGKGAEVYARACAACHPLGGQGTADLGPDLATVRHRPPLLLLGDILMPSQSIAQRYETYLVERAGGATEAGVLASQTPTSITLRQGPGTQVTIDRRDIKSLTASPQSSMPSDLDKLITPAEMADLLAYIRSGR